MATISQAKKQTPANYDVYVEAQLERARRRIRTLDLTTALLGFLAGTLAFAFLMAVLDSSINQPVGLSVGVRVVAFFLYLGAAGTYLGFSLFRPLTQRINPYFAARQVEQALPGAKNSVVNWLDLHEDEKLPGAIQGAIAARAAKDLARADLEKAVSGRRAGWTGLASGLLLGALVVLMFTLEGRLFSHLGRAFLPFGDGAIPSRTTLTILEPQGGHATVTQESPLTFRVRVEGRDPKVVKLLTRPAQEGDAKEHWMEPDPEVRNVWVFTLPGREVQSPGFYYRVEGGDGFTDEYRIDTRATPAVDGDRFLATFRPRPYLGQKVERVQVKDRELRDLEGTEVELHVPTNRRLRDGRLDLTGPDGKPRPVPAQILAGDEKALRFKFVLEQPGKGTYTLHFTSLDGEFHSDAPYPLEVRDDRAPLVELKKPGMDIALKANELLHLEGVANDDVGVREMVLHMKVENGDELAPKPYRSEKEIQLPGGGFPLVLDYKDFVDLTKLKAKDGREFAAKAGMKLEYWLEASDACDFPKPNVGETKHYKVIVVEPDANKDQNQQKQERQQAEQDKKDHEQRQDEKLKNENDKRREGEKKQEQANDQNRKDAEKKPGKNGGEGEKKPPEKNPNPDDKKNDQGTEGKKDERTEAQKKKDEETEQKRKKLEEAAAKHEEQKRNAERGSAKDDGTNDKRGECKNGEGAKEGENKDGGKDQRGAGKGNPEPMNGKNEDRAKDGEKKNAPEGSAGSGKQEGRKEAGGEDKGAGKDKGQPKPDEKQAEGKDGKQGDNASGRAEAKKQPPREGAGQAGQEKKADGTPQSEGGQRGAPKERGPDSGTPESKPGQEGVAKGEPKQSPPGGAKENGKAPEQAGSAKSAPKEGDPMRGDPTPRSEGKGGPKDGDTKQETASAKDGKTAGDRKEKTGGAGEEKPAEVASKDDVDQLGKDLQSPDPKKRQEAGRKLENIERDAHDGAAREAAREELEKGEREGKVQRSVKQPPQGQAGDTKERDEKTPTPTASGKEGEKKENAGKEGAAKGERKTENDPGMGEKKKGEGEGDGKGEAKPGQPGQQTARGDNTGGKGPTTDVTDPTGPDSIKSDNRHSDRAGNLQLDRFDEQVKKKILKDAGLDDSDLRDIRDLTKREAVNNPAKPLGPDGKPLPTSGVTPIKPVGEGSTGDTAADGLPPVEYRDLYQDFTKRIAEIEKKKSK